MNFAPSWRPATFDVLDVPISAIDPEQAVRSIEQWVEARARTYVCITGVHGVIECGRDAALRKIHEEAGLVTPDGMPLVWMAHARGLSAVRRVYGPDLMRRLSARAPRTGHRHFYYGGAEGVADELRLRLQAENPGLDVVGVVSPPFRPMTDAEDADLVETINRAKPDILWVGLSTPKQERWMNSHRGRLDVPVMIGVGAAFDFLSGRKRQAPYWMQRCGLEWFFRLISEPRRLYRRYFTMIPLFLFRVLRGNNKPRRLIK
ncbi:glycosyl transferase [Aureimonas sp. Leaf454]|nr:glycosyl transferase [Aureimonas sp. Leaf454]